MTSKADAPPFETALKQLEEIVQRLEKGELTLEESLGLYEQGIRLSRLCHAKLEEAEGKIEMLVKNNATMNLKSAGRLLFPKDVFELEGAHWIADIELVNFPATLVKEYVGARVPIRSMAGQLAQRVHVEGNPGRQLKVKGDLEFKQLALDAPEVFLAPLNRVDGRTSFEFDWDRRRLQIVRAEYRANDVRFSLQGEVSALDRDDPHVRLNFSALSAP